MTIESTHTEETWQARSAIVLSLLHQQVHRSKSTNHPSVAQCRSTIPKTVLQYWHDLSNLPSDVRRCINSWQKLRDYGFEFCLHSDVSASEYIALKFGQREKAAFARCAHPAMRSDYLRLCFIVAEGGIYVDADDVLVGDSWSLMFDNDHLKLQPLCYDLSVAGMMPAEEIWNPDTTLNGRIFYVNNNPLVAPPRHPLLISALTQATDRLLGVEPLLEIQATTGPGNLTMALVAHARHLQANGLPFDFEFIKGWDSIAEVRWNLSYRGDDRNWRNVYRC